MTAFHPKMTAAVLAGALTVVLVAECKRRGIDIDGTEGSSITLIFSFLAGFFMPSDDAGNAGVSEGAPTPAAKPPAGTQSLTQSVLPESVLIPTLPTARNTGVER